MAGRVALLSHLGTLAPPEAVSQLVALTASVATAGDPTACRALAEALPAAVGGLAPEVCLALQQLAQALAPYGPRLPGDLDTLSPRLQVLWLRTGLESGAPVDLARLDDAFLLLVVTGWKLDAVPEPLPLASRLARARDARLRVWWLSQLEPAVQSLALTPPQAYECLRPLLEPCVPEESTLRCAALRLAAKCWCAGLSPAALRHREGALAAALECPERQVVAAAVSACAALGLRAPLAAALTATGTDDETRARVLHALGPSAHDEDLDTALDLAAQDPLRYGPPVRVFLLEAHRHGVFVRAGHLPRLLDLYDAHWTFAPDELLRVTHIARADLLRRLAELPADDPRWRRRAPLLAASVAAGAAELLAERLDATAVAANAAAFIEAAGACPTYEGESRLLRWLDALPEAVIPALRVKGGTEAPGRLRALVEDPFTPAAVRALAFEGVWAHTADRPALLRALSRTLGPHDAFLLDGRHVSPRDPTLAELLADPPWEMLPEHTVEPLQKFEILCESGEIRHLPEVTRLFRELFRGCVRQALAGDFRVKRLQIPELEQRLFRYGRHLLAAGRSIRRAVAATPETGRDLILRVGLEWLAETGRQAPSSAVCVALLEMLGRHTPDGATLRAIEPYWRRGVANVRRAAIEATLASDGAHGLEFSLCGLVDAPDPRLVTQALEAVAGLKAGWAEPLARRALERPEMGVKKAAAAALAVVGDQASVPALVRWLAHHDNQSLRAALGEALEHAAGPSSLAVLVDALDSADALDAADAADAADAGDPDAARSTRQSELLWRALSGRLTLPAAVRLARSERRAHRALVAACLAGRVALAGATPDDLATCLHVARLRIEKPGSDPARRLRLEGFTRSAAEAAAAARDSTHDDRLLPIVRQAFASWVTWLHATPECVRAAPLTLVLDAAERTHAEHFDRLLDCVERAGAALAPVTVAAFFERSLTHLSAVPAERVRAATCLRGLAPSAGLGGLRRYRLLGALSAVRTPTDLESCLAECRLRPDLPGESLALLTEALALPRLREPRASNPPGWVSLVEEARAWYRREPAAASAWLVARVAERPLDLPPLPEPLEPPARPPFQPQSTADREALRAALSAEDPQERHLAAARLLDWDDARDAHPDVLAAWLQGRLELPSRLAALAGLLNVWPEAGQAQAQGRALTLVPWLGAPQLRLFVPAWLDAWEAGDTQAEIALRAVAPAQLLPFVVARVRQGVAAGRPNYRLARLVNAGPRHTAAEGPTALAVRALIALVESEAPEEVAHLRPLRAAEPAAEPTTDSSLDPVDPLAALDRAALVALIDSKGPKGTEIGLAVRAVHALARHGGAAVAVLERLCTDRRPTVRSAALRVLRTVGTREQSLAAALAALRMETRKDVVLQLMSSLGHGRHAPAMPELLERLVDPEPRVRAGARAALRGWGAEAIPAVRHAARRARPDRQPEYHALLSDLEGGG